MRRVARWDVCSYFVINVKCCVDGCAEVPFYRGIFCVNSAPGRRRVERMKL